MQLTIDRPESIIFRVQRQVILRGMEGTGSTEMILFMDPDQPKQEHLGIVRPGEGALEGASRDVKAQGMHLIYAGPILHYIETEDIPPTPQDELPPLAKVFRHRLTGEYFKRTPTEGGNRTQYVELASMFDGDAEDWRFVFPADYDPDDWDFIELPAGTNAYTIELDLRQLRMLTNILKNAEPSEGVSFSVVKEARSLASMLHWAIYHLSPGSTFRVQSAQSSEGE